eukprot:804731-Amphidinium_carterae.1
MSCSQPVQGTMKVLLPATQTLGRLRNALVIEVGDEAGIQSTVENLFHTHLLQLLRTGPLAP